jgi:hypothetical protein
MYTPENLSNLLGKRFKASIDYRPLFLHYSKTYDTWGIYFSGDKNSSYHPSLEHTTAQKICDWLNSPYYTITVI